MPPSDTTIRWLLRVWVILGPPLFTLLALRPDLPCLPGYGASPGPQVGTLLGDFLFAVGHPGLSLPLTGAFLALFIATLAAPRLAPAESETARLLGLVAAICILAALFVPAFTPAPEDCASGPVAWTIFSQVFLITAAATALAWFAGQHRDAA